jgi:hypothetical protein
MSLLHDLVFLLIPKFVIPLKLFCSVYTIDAAGFKIPINRIGGVIVSDECGIWWVQAPIGPNQRL